MPYGVAEYEVKGSPMQYKFVAAYCVYGMAMPPEKANVTLFLGNGVHVYLAHDPTQPLALIDRQTALVYLMLSGLVGQSTGPDRQAARNSKVREILEARSQRYKGCGFLIVEIDGDVDATIPTNCRDEEDFRVCLDAYDKKALLASLQPNVVSAMAAVRMADKTDYRFEQVTQGSVLIDDGGAVVHSFSIDLGAAGFTVGRVLSAEQVEEMREFIVPLRESPELEQAIDLHAQSLNRQENKLRAFMAAWNALELFANEVKTKYGPLWLDERDNPATSSDRRAELESIPDNNSKLARIFGKMACYLSGDRQILDIVEFMKLKNIRNDLSHELKDNGLPADRVHSLLDKYLKEHLRHR